MLLQEVEALREKEQQVKQQVARFNVDPEVVAEMQGKAEVRSRNILRKSICRNDNRVTCNDRKRRMRPTRGRTIFSPFRVGVKTNSASLKKNSTNNLTYRRTSITKSDYKE